MQHLRIVGSLLVVLGLGACGAEGYSIPENTGTETASTTATDGNTTQTGSVTWASSISAIVQTNCNSCHGTGMPYNGVFDSSTQASVTASATSVASEVTSGDMPPGAALSAADKKSIAAWVAANEP